MLKKILILLCFTIISRNVSASEMLQEEITAQLETLYVFQDGLVRPLGVTVDETNLDCLNGKRLFPYSVDGQVIWFGENDFLPAQMSSDEQLFIRKISTYLDELAEQGNIEELHAAIKSIKVYQLKNGGDTLPSAFAEKTDCFYNNRTINNLVFSILLIVFISTTILLFRHIIKHRQISTRFNLLIAVFIQIYIVLNLSCRWIIGRHIPFTSNYEILLFLSFCLTIMAIFLSKEHNTALICNPIALAIILLSNLLCDNSIKALDSALDSPLLGYHVVITIISYAIFFIMALNGIIGLLTKNEKTDQKMRRFNSKLLLPGTTFLGIGILIGSIWAKTAWGSYWSWDPKETWALITLIVYVFGVFANESSIFLKDKRFHLFCIIAFAFVIFTFFGVNYLFKGFHSYIG